MADPAPSRVDPVIETGSVPASESILYAAPPSEPAAASRPPVSVDQLSRIEEKAARIEEKYARTEALLQRVEAKMDTTFGRMAESARQADLSAVREQVTGLTRSVRSLPGLTALVTVAIVTALLTSAITLAVLKYGIPGLPPR